jgi:hypothetical protein
MPNTPAQERDILGKIDSGCNTIQQSLKVLKKSKNPDKKTKVEEAIIRLIINVFDYAIKGSDRSEAPQQNWFESDDGKKNLLIWLESGYLQKAKQLLPQEALKYIPSPNDLRAPTENQKPRKFQEENLFSAKKQAQPDEAKKPPPSDEETKQAQSDLRRKLDAATSIEDIIKVINENPAPLLDHNGKPIPKEEQIQAIRVAQRGRGPFNVNTGAYFDIDVTSNYDLQAKVNQLVEKENKLVQQQQDKLYTLLRDIYSEFGKEWSGKRLDTGSLKLSFLPMSESSEPMTNIRKKIIEEFRNLKIPFSAGPNLFTIIIPQSQFEELIKKLEKQIAAKAQSDLQKKLDEATSIDDIIRVINEHPAPLLNQEGSPLSKEDQIQAIKDIQQGTTPSSSFTKKVTSNYNLEAKVSDLVEKEKKFKQEDRRPRTVSPMMKNLKAKEETHETSLSTTPTPEPSDRKTQKQGGS